MQQSLLETGSGEVAPVTYSGIFSSLQQAIKDDRRGLFIGGNQLSHFLAMKFLNLFTFSALAALNHYFLPSGADEPMTYLDEQLDEQLPAMYAAVTAAVFLPQFILLVPYMAMTSYLLGTSEQKKLILNVCFAAADFIGFKSVFADFMALVMGLPGIHELAGAVIGLEPTPTFQHFIGLSHAFAILMPIINAGFRHRSQAEKIDEAVSSYQSALTNQSDPTHSESTTGESSDEVVTFADFMQPLLDLDVAKTMVKSKASLLNYIAWLSAVAATAAQLTVNFTSDESEVMSALKPYLVPLSMLLMAGVQAFKARQLLSEQTHKPSWGAFAPMALMMTIVQMGVNGLFNIVTPASHILHIIMQVFGAVMAAIVVKPASQNYALGAINGSLTQKQVDYIDRYKDVVWKPRGEGATDAIETSQVTDLRPDQVVVGGEELAKTSMAKLKRN